MYDKDLVAALFEGAQERYGERNGGYTRIKADLKVWGLGHFLGKHTRLVSVSGGELREPEWEGRRHAPPFVACSHMKFAQCFLVGPQVRRGDATEMAFIELV